MSLIFFLSLASSIIPATTYASSDLDYQSNCFSEFFQGFSLSSALSFFKNDDQQTNHNFNSTHDYSYYRNDDNSMDNIWKWLVYNGDIHQGDNGNDYGCYYSKGSWWDKDDCIESKKIWEKWYCF